MKRQFAIITSPTLKKWLRYLIYAIILFAYLILFAAVYNHYEALYKETFQYFPIELIATLGDFIIGLLLGLEHFLKEKKTEGKWSFNVARFVLIGIPGLIVGIYPVICYCGIPIISSTMYYILQFVGSSTWLLLVGRILFGYILITSFSKRNILSSSVDSTKQ